MGKYFQARAIAQKVCFGAFYCVAAWGHRDWISQSKQLFEVVEICYVLVKSFILMRKIKICLTLELKILGVEAAEPWPCLTRDRWVLELPTQETGAPPCFEQTLPC